jgi:hypothetical protein
VCTKREDSRANYLASWLSQRPLDGADHGVKDAVNGLRISSVCTVIPLQGLLVTERGQGTNKKRAAQIDPVKDCECGADERQTGVMNNALGKRPPCRSVRPVPCRVEANVIGWPRPADSGAEPPHRRPFGARDIRRRAGSARPIQAGSSPRALAFST